jgi:hypothetical protein
MPNYSDSIIYKLCCRNTDIEYYYIGSTINFSRRKSEHKSICNNENHHNHNMPVYKYIRENGEWDNFDMIQIESYNAKDKRDLHSRERYWIEKLKPKLNINIPTRTQKESYVANRESKLEYVKKYRADNKDMIHIKSKKFREKHKEKIQKKYQEKFSCYCGGSYTKYNNLKHFRTEKHKFYDETYNFIYS